MPTIETGHFPNRAFLGQDGSLVVNGGTLLNASGVDCEPFLNSMLASGVLASGQLVQMGSATGTGSTLREEGTIFAKFGAPIAGNAADTTDDILLGFQLPASIFDVANRTVQIYAMGKTGATANAGKRIKLWSNPTMSGQTVNADGSITGGTVTGAGSGNLLADSGTTAINAKGWEVLGAISKYGAAGANTQVFHGGSIILDTTHGGVLAPIALTYTESAVINIVLTGSSAQSGASDIALYALLLTGCN